MANYQPSDLIRKNSSIIEAHETTRNFITSDTSSGDKTFAGGVFGVAAANFQPKNEIEEYRKETTRHCSHGSY